MAPEELFPLYAELSVALAGFAGVVSAFAGRDRIFQPTELVRFLAVVMAAAIVLVGCFTFFVAKAAGLDVETSLRLCGIGPIALIVTAVLTLYRSAVRASREPGSTTEPWSLRVSLAVFLTNVALLLAAILTDASYACIVAAFSLQFLHGLWMFVRVLTRAN